MNWRRCWRTRCQWVRCGWARCGWCGWARCGWCGWARCGLSAITRIVAGHILDIILGVHRVVFAIVAVRVIVHDKESSEEINFSGNLNVARLGAFVSTMKGLCQRSHADGLSFILAVNAYCFAHSEPPLIIHRPPFITHSPFFAHPLIF